MEEGVRLVSGMPGVDPATLELDQPVEAYLEERTDEIALPCFRPREPARSQETA
jgi:hypothetical protein